MTTQQVYLVTGGARGLGKGFVSALLQRQNTTVIAGVRDPCSSTSKALRDLRTADGSNLIVVKIDSSSDTNAKEAVAELKSKHNIGHIDVVIANAAVVAPPAPVASASIEDFRTNFQVNAFAPMLLFQATWPLLQKSANPKFIGISTCLATISKMEDWSWSTVVYGSSKAAMNYIVRKMHFENERLVAFVVHPGYVTSPG
jgi:norsolorinic acid ketoreductase